MRAHERTDHNDSATSNEMFWSLVSLALTIACVVAGTLLGDFLK